MSVVFRIAGLAKLVGVVADVEVPAHRRVLTGEGMEGRHIIVVGKASRSDSAGVAARLDQEYARNWSLRKDGYILLLTALVVMQRKGAY